MSKQLTHKELVLKARHWLLSRFRCGVSLAEGFAFEGERPDAIGWKLSQARRTSFAVSYLVECKANRRDFLADKRKKFRANPSKGIGNYRYYLINKGVAAPADLPDKWGLAVATQHQIRLVRIAKPFHGAFINEAERTMLYLTLRSTIIRRGH